MFETTHILVYSFQQKLCFDAVNGTVLTCCDMSHLSLSALCSWTFVYIAMCVCLIPRLLCAFVFLIMRFCFFLCHITWFLLSCLLACWLSTLFLLVPCFVHPKICFPCLAVRVHVTFKLSNCTFLVYFLCFLLWFVFCVMQLGPAFNCGVTGWAIN